jgi:hypothetical protein
MSRILVPTWAISIASSIAEDFDGLSREGLLEVIRVHSEVIINKHGEVRQGHGRVIAYRLLGRKWIHVYLNDDEPRQELWGADFRGFEVRTGPEGTMRVV